MKNQINIAVLFLSLCWIPFSASGQTDEAQELFKKAEVMFRNADYADAIKVYDEAIRLSPDYSKALLQRGFCKNLTNDFAGAVDDFTRVIELNPDHKWAYLSRGSARNKTGDYQGAIQDFDKALEMDPKDQEAYNNRGFSKKLAGDKQGACEDWNTSKKLGNDEARIILKNNGCK
jgi:tetratricopeptide (TPR) repeat protein